MELVVRECRSRREILVISLAFHVPAVGMQGMHAAVQQAVSPPALQDHVAGRIDAPHSTLKECVDAWLAHLVRLKKKPRSVAAFRHVVTKAIRETGWRSEHDLTYDAVTRWLGSHGWMGTTYNRNLSVFRSLTKYLTKTRRITEDPLMLAERAENDGSTPQRAATLEEARKIIMHAWVRFLASKHCKCNRALYWACLFHTGARLEEPANWRRKNIVLEHKVPHIWWTPDIHKNGKEYTLAIHPELVQLLREHLEQDDQERAAAGLAPATPQDKVFRVVPTKTTLTKDRDSSGIAAADYRGRTFSARSARKYFSTQGTALGIPEKMIDRLMRHAGKVEARYYDPSLEEQILHVEKFPSLWPNIGETRGVSPHRKCGESETRQSDLTRGGQTAEHSAATAVPKEPHSTSAVSPLASSPRWHPGDGYGGAVESELLRLSGVRSRSNARDRRDDPPRVTRSEMPRGGLEPPTSGL
jgi:integrase